MRVYILGQKELEKFSTLHLSGSNGNAREQIKYNSDLYQPF